MKKIFLKFRYLILFFLFLEIFLRTIIFLYLVIFQKTDNFLLNKYKDHKNILCIGESTTLGMGVRPSESYPNILQELIIASALKFKYKVYNLGIPGIKSYKILERLNSNITKYKPSLIIFLFGANDLEGEKFIGKKNFEKLAKRKPSMALSFVSKLKLVRIGMLFYNRLLIKFKYIILKDRLDMPGTINSKIQELIFKEFERNIISIIETCERSNVTCIFSDYLFNTVTGETNSALNVLSDKHNFILVKQSKYIEENGINEKSISCKDLWHPNANGHKIMAENILKTIIENKLLE